VPDPEGAGTICAAFDAAGSGRVAVRACDAVAVAAALDSGACGGAATAAVRGAGGAVGGLGRTLAAAVSRPPFAARASGVGAATAAGLAFAAPASGVGLAGAVSRSPLAAVASGVAGFGVPPRLALPDRARDVAVFARGLAAAFPGRAGVVLPDRAGVVFDRVLAVFFDCEDAAVVFDREPGPDAVGRVLAVGRPDGAGPVPSAVGGRASDPVAGALAWSWSAEAALADRGWLAARGWLSMLAGGLLAARLGAGPVPCPVELSPWIPFSEVTAP
jgi:hypothetical protein